MKAATEIVDRLVALVEEMHDCPEKCASKASRLLCVQCWKAKVTCDTLSWVLGDKEEA